MEVNYEVSSYQVPAELSFGRQLSSAAQSRALPCPAVQCGTVLCRAVPCCVLCCIYSFVHATYHSSYNTRYQYTGFVRITLLNYKKCTPSSAQRRAMPCRALWCSAVPCCDVLRCAFFRTYSSWYRATYQISWYRYVRVYSSVCPLNDCPLSVLFMFFFAKYASTAVLKVTSKATTQHATAQGNQLYTSNCWLSMSISI